MLAGQYPTEGKKVLDLLLAMDVKVQMPDGLVFYGGPLMWVGDRKQTEKAFETNIDILINAGVEQVITPCPGVWVTLKKDYNDYYKAKNGKELPFTIIDMTELLANKLNSISLKKSKPLKVTYHSPCHHGKGQGLLDKSLAVLKAAPGIEFIDTKITNMCCGGMTLSSNPSMTLDLSSKVIEEAEKDDIDVLVTNCVFCRDNLNRAARCKRSKLKVEHLLLYSYRKFKKQK